MENQEKVSFLLNEDEQELIRMFRELSFLNKSKVYLQAKDFLEIEKTEEQQQTNLAPIINFPRK